MITDDIRKKLKADIENEMELRNLNWTTIRGPKKQHKFPVGWRILTDICKRPTRKLKYIKQFAILRLLKHFEYNYEITEIKLIGKKNEK